MQTHLTCFLVEGALASDECARLIAEADRTGFTQMATKYPPTYRNNDRLVLDDPRLSGALFAHLRPRLPNEVRDERGDIWKLVGLNERFRFCRYQGGQNFSLHQDGAFARSENERSLLSCMLYLNDASEFGGGSTRYYSAGTPDAGEIGRVAPRAGTAIVFDHGLWHDGQPVTRGTKYVMRTDVMYRRFPTEKPQGAGSPISQVVGEWKLQRKLEGHTGYVWALRQLRDGSLASASRDRSVRLWRTNGRGWRQDEHIQEHTASVTALAEAADGTLWSGSRDGTIRSQLSIGSRRIANLDSTVLALEQWDNKRMASSGADGIVRVWDAQGNGPAIECRGHTGWTWGLAKLSGLLASGSEDGTIRLWDVEPKERVCSVSAGAPVRSLAAFGPLLAAGLSDGRVQIWKLNEALPHALVLVREAVVHRGAVTCLSAFGSALVASGGEDSQVRLCRVDDLQPLASLPHGGFVRAVVDLGEGLLASASYDGFISIWERGCTRSGVAGLGGLADNA